MANATPNTAYEPDTRSTTRGTLPTSQSNRLRYRNGNARTSGRTRNNTLERCSNAEAMGTTNTGHVMQATKASTKARLGDLSLAIPRTSGAPSVSMAPEMASGPAQ